MTSSGRFWVRAPRNRTRAPAVRHNPHSASTSAPRAELGAATGYGPPGPAHANPAGFVRYATSVLDCFEGMPFEERREVLALQVANRCLLRKEHAEDDGILRL